MPAHRPTLVAIRHGVRLTKRDLQKRPTKETCKTIQKRPWKRHVIPVHRPMYRWAAPRRAPFPPLLVPIAPRTPQQSWHTPHCRRLPWSWSENVNVRIHIYIDIWMYIYFNIIRIYTCIYIRTYKYIHIPHCNTLQHTATHCNTLQHTATHCNTLQHTASIYFLCGIWIMPPTAMLIKYWLLVSFDIL